MKKFSVIMPSYLGEYKNAAKVRDEKIVRAVESVLKQDADYELIVIADGCDKTVDIVSPYLSEHPKLRLLRIDDKRDFGAKRNAGSSGVPRNVGIQNSNGEYIIYLDIDDFYRDGYLQELQDLITDHDWYWFDTLSYNRKTDNFDTLVCDIDTQGACGTANLCHKKSIGSWWSTKTHYLHDWMFISTLKAVGKNYKRLDIAGYCICHVPNLLDV